MRNKRIYIFIGTTAELIKLAPVIKELRKKKADFKLITSGQNKILFKELAEYTGPLKVDIAFKEKGERSSIFYFVLWAIRTFFVGMVSLRREFGRQNKDNSYFIVHGDTISSLLGALIAKIGRLKLVHIESGLRSFSFLEPFPEEISRYIISHLADIHFCPNDWSTKNLKEIEGRKVNTRQNTLIEIYWWATKKKKELKTIKNKYFVLVVHRQEHVFFKKRKIKKILEYLLRNTKGYACVFIMHKVTLQFLESTGYKLAPQEGLILMPRLPYADFMALVEKSEYIITDGGSNQEEAYYMGKPCLLLRSRTERIEGLGENVVLSKYNKRVIKEFINNYEEHKRSKKYRNDIEKIPSEVIVDFLIKDSR